MKGTRKTEKPEGKPVFVRLDPETEAGLRSLAAEEDRPLSTMIRRLVREALDARSKEAA